MKVSTFYRTASCKQKAEFESLCHTSPKGHEYYMPQALQMLTEEYKKGATTEAIVETVTSFLDASFDVQDVEIASWAKEEQLDKDAIAFRRFINWFREQEEKVLEVNRQVSMKLPVADGELSDNVHLITKALNGSYRAYILLGKSADKSQKGKSVHTQVNTDLHAMLAKAALEKQYPEIRIRLVYLFSEADGKAVTMPERMSILPTKASNLFAIDYSSYYDGTRFDTETFCSLMERVIKTPLPMDCGVCEHASYCNELRAVKAVSRKKVEEEKQVGYQLPEYSAEQQKVVCHVSGPIRVFAGPGSGKTATVVGRIHNLITEHDVEPELILAVTFSNEAAKELKLRCADLNFSGEPVISTIHALAYKILVSHEGVLGRKYKLMKEPERDELISACLEAEDGPIENLTYGRLHGQRGIIKRAGDIALAYTLAKEEEKEAILKEYQLGSDFERMALRFQSMKNRNGYITFDEMVPEVLRVFAEYPEILEKYRQRFWYIMVDEFQDISEEQFQFIVSLCGNQNLMAVADDDQAIYKFRKGDSRFIREMDKFYPSVQTVILRENYRSRPEIVKASQKMITENQERMQKDIISTRKEGGNVSVLPTASKEQIAQAVAGALDAGYAYKDIAIIASKNRTLETIAANSEFPCVLQKNYLRNDYLFKTIYYVLQLISKSFADEESMAHLLVSQGLEARIKGNGSLYERAYCYYRIGTDKEDKKAAKFFLFLKDSVQLFDCQPEPSIFVDAVAMYLRMDNTISYDTFLEWMEEKKISTLPKLLQNMRHMVLYEDTTMVPVDHSEAVLLITAHEAKGLEFPVVLLADDFAKEPTEESRRVFYVAMTRAKEDLKILKSSGCFAEEVERELYDKNTLR